jgi:hypothetical protein
MNRRFGVEIEACLIVEYNKHFAWIDYIKDYLHKIGNNMSILNIQFAGAYEHTVIIKTEKYDEDALIYKYNLLTHECIEDELYDVDYKYPIISPDYSIVCHDYTYGFINSYEHPSEYNELSVSKRNFLINSKTYSVNIELITNIFDNFQMYIKFKELFMPAHLMFILNKSQGLHLNIDIHDISTSTLKNILLNKYIPWEQENARMVRPFKSKYAMELDHIDIVKISKCSNINQLSNILNKYRSVNIKCDIDVIEMRIFSLLGSDIDTHLYNVYRMFTLIGGRIYSKKMRHRKNKTIKLAKAK